MSSDFEREAAYQTAVRQLRAERAESTIVLWVIDYIRHLREEEEHKNMAKPVPTLYEMEPLGVNDELEATHAMHFCSEQCRSDYPRTAGQAYSEGTEATPGEYGEVCEHCGVVLHWPEEEM